jgi:hypothetical protein
VSAQDSLRDVAALSHTVLPSLPAAVIASTEEAVSVITYSD